MRRPMIFALAVAASVAAAWAADNGSATADAVAEILRNNPGLAAERARMGADLENESAENVLGGPEAEFEYKFGPYGEENRWGLSVGQKFDWPGVYSARRNALAKRRTAFGQLHRAAAIDVALEARRLIIDLQRARGEAALLAQAEANVSRLTELYDYAFARGETTILEVKKLRLQRFALATRRAEADAAVDALRGQLATLNGGTAPAVPDAAMAISSLRAEADYRAELEANDPAVAARRSLADAAAADVSTARRKSLPGFSVAYVHDFEEGTHFNGFGIGIELPAWSNRRTIAAAKASAMSAELEQAQYALTRLAELTADYAAASRLEGSLRGMEGDFEGDVYPALLSKALDGGRLNLFDYLREYNDYLDAKIDYLAMVARYESLVASLERHSLLPADYD